MTIFSSVVPYHVVVLPIPTRLSAGKKRHIVLSNADLWRARGEEVRWCRGNSSLVEEKVSDQKLANYTIVKHVNLCLTFCFIMFLVI